MAIAIALINAGTTIVGLSLTITGLGKIEMNITAGTFLYAIIEILIKTNWYAFITSLTFLTVTTI